MKAASARVNSRRDRRAGTRGTAGPNALSQEMVANDLISELMH